MHVVKMVVLMVALKARISCLLANMISGLPAEALCYQEILHGIDLHACAVTHVTEDVARCAMPWSAAS